MNWSYIVELAQVIGAVAAVIAIPLSVVLYLRAKPKSVLSYAFSQPIELASLNRSRNKSTGVGEIQILYDGRSVSNVFLLRVRIQNHGNQALKSQSVHIPLTMTFPDDIRILDAQVVQTVPDRIEATLSVEPHLAIVGFELLNPDDRIYINLICEGKPTNPKVLARFEGATQLVEALWEYRVRKDANDRTPFVVALLPAIITTYIVYYFSPSRPNYSIIQYIIIPFVFIFIYIAIGAYLSMLSGIYYRLTGRKLP